MSDSEFTQFDAAMQNGLSKYKFLEPPVAMNTTMDVVCVNKTYGRYVYISMLRESSGDGYFQLYEVEVYMGELVEDFTEIHRSTIHTCD